MVEQREKWKHLSAKERKKRREEKKKMLHRPFESTGEPLKKACHSRERPIPIELGRRTIHVAAKTGMQESGPVAIIWLYHHRASSSDDLINTLLSCFRAIDVVDVFNAVIEFAERVSDSSVGRRLPRTASPVIA